MHCISRSLFTCVAACALAITCTSAAVHASSIAAAPLVATSTASSPQAPNSRSRGANRRPSRAPTRVARKTRETTVPKPPARVTTYKGSNKNFAAAEKAVQAESNARTERLYRASQFSAPIIIDAKACKRVGAHGESIYENC